MAVGATTLLGSLYLATPVAAQDVIEGETTVVNLRETDGRLGPLVTTLIALGVGTLLATIVFWFMTRPGRHAERTPNG